MRPGSPVQVTGGPAGPRWGLSWIRTWLTIVVETAQRVVASGAISANGHGNVSLRVPGAAEMYFTAGPSLRNHPASAVVRVGLDGTLLEGELPPIQGACGGHAHGHVRRPPGGGLRPAHPLALRHGLCRGPPADRLLGRGAGDVRPGRRGTGGRDTGPAGRKQAVAGIRAAVTPGVPAVLLANHGVLIFHRSPGPGDPGRRGGRRGRSGWHQRGRARRPGGDRGGHAGGGVERSMALAGHVAVTRWGPGGTGRGPVRSTTRGSSRAAPRLPVPGAARGLPGRPRSSSGGRGQSR